MQLGADDGTRSVPAEIRQLVDELKRTGERPVPPLLKLAADLSEDVILSAEQNGYLLRQGLPYEKAATALAHLISLFLISSTWSPADDPDRG